MSCLGMKQNCGSRFSSIMCFIFASDSICACGYPIVLYVAIKSCLVPIFKLSSKLVENGIFQGYFYTLVLTAFVCEQCAFVKEHRYLAKIYAVLKNRLWKIIFLSCRTSCQSLSNNVPHLFDDSETTVSQSHAPNLPGFGGPRFVRRSGVTEWLMTNPGEQVSHSNEFDRFMSTHRSGCHKHSNLARRMAFNRAQLRANALAASHFARDNGLGGNGQANLVVVADGLPKHSMLARRLGLTRAQVPADFLAASHRARDNGLEGNGQTNLVLVADGHPFGPREMIKFFGDVEQTIQKLGEDEDSRRNLIFDVLLSKPCNEHTCWQLLPSIFERSDFHGESMSDGDVAPEIAVEQIPSDEQLVTGPVEDSVVESASDFASDGTLGESTSPSVSVDTSVWKSAAEDASVSVSGESTSSFEDSSENGSHAAM